MADTIIFACHAVRIADNSVVISSSSLNACPLLPFLITPDSTIPILLSRAKLPDFTIFNSHLVESLSTKYSMININVFE